MTFADTFIIGLLGHLFADWFLQSDYQAAHKTNLLHPAAWLHFGCHLGVMLLLWPVVPVLIVCVTHALIDTRKPLAWWRKMMRQKQFRPGLTQVDGSFVEGVWWNVTAMQVAFWQDQAAHILMLGGVAWAIVKGWLG